MIHCRVNPNVGSDIENTMTFFFKQRGERRRDGTKIPPTPPPNKKCAIETFPLLMSLLSEQPIEIAFLA